MLTNSSSAKAASAANLLSELVPVILQGVQFSIISQNNLSTTQFFIMIVIDRPGKITMSALAKRMQMSLPRATGLVNRLIKQDLLERNTTLEDRRLVIVSLTAKGKKLIESYKKLIRNRWQEVLEGMNNRDISTFSSFVKKLLTKVKMP